MPEPLTRIAPKPLTPSRVVVPLRVPPASDESIVLGLARGEAWAADQLYDRVLPHVQASLRRILRRGGADYEDLVQASFERILRVLMERSLKAPYNLAGWASAVAGHVALDALRRRVREHRLLGGDTASEVGERVHGPARDPERELSARAEVQRVQTLLSGMREKYAEAVVLHDVLGHELTAIAEITGLTVAAAQSRLVRGRKELIARARATSAAEGSGALARLGKKGSP